MTHIISPDSIFIFDVDGVITNPHTKIPNPFIVDFIAKELKDRKPVAIGTGRGEEWLQQHLIPLIAAKVSHKASLDNLFLAGEKGSVSITFAHGDAEVQIDEGIFVPTAIREKIREKVAEYPAIFDNGKKTMISIEIEGGEDEENIKQQKAALDALQSWIQKEIQPEKYHLLMERSVIALDLQQEQVSKRLVAEKFLAFMSHKHFTQTSFTVFGDSPSDIHIAELLDEEGYLVTFGYVGFRELKNDYQFSIIYAKKQFDQGVIELLPNTYNK